ncbi:MAG: PepSY domain-containing protein, partial [Alphaproteobacteria bacterium]
LVGLAIGAQLLLWTTGGIVMSWLPIEKVRGEHHMAEPADVPISARALPPALREPLAGRAVLGIELRHGLGHSLAEVRFADGPPALFDATTGEKLSPIDERMARAAALADYAGKARISRIHLLSGKEETPQEYRGPLPVWQIRIDDGEGTRLYVSPNVGRVVARRNDMWRFYDFFWMLHIMDYDAREDFNNLLLRIAAVFGAIMAASGIGLLFWRVHRRDFRFRRRRSG